MFKNILFLFISILSFNSFAVDNEDGYNWGNYNHDQYKWLGDIQNSFNTSNVMKLNCNKSNDFSCKLKCDGNVYDKINLMFVGNDNLGTRIITFYRSSGLFEMIQTQDTCSYSNFIPMIEYSYDGNV